MSALGDWIRQSAASAMGTGMVGRSARATALKTDRALRNISKDVWSKVASEIDADARQGRYFGCYAVPRSSLHGNGFFNFARGVKRRGFYAMTTRRPDVGDKFYSDIAIFWAHKSDKLKKPEFKDYLFDLTMVFFAECAAYGLDKFYTPLLTNDVSRLVGDTRSKQTAEYFSQNFIRYVAMYLHKGDVPSVMRFHVPVNRTPQQIAANACGIMSMIFGSHISGKITYKFDGGAEEHDVLDQNAIVRELEYYKELYNSSESENDAIANSYRLLAQIGKV